MLTVSQLLSIHEKLKAKRAAILLDGNEIEVTFEKNEDKTETATFLSALGVRTDSFNRLSLSFKNQQVGLQFFDRLDTLLDQLNLDISILDNHDIFVFDLDGHYFFYEHANGQVTSNSTLSKVNYIIPHFRQYKALLDIYLSAEGTLYEIKRNSVSGSEFVVLSKGEKKMVSAISYQLIDKAIFVDDNLSIPISDFQNKILSQEWLACYNETLCQFMDAQNSGRRTFSNLFNNSNYLLNLANQNFQLYILKFSFEKIRKQYKTEKNNYFDNLNTAQDKISGQIISVPISLGATIFSFYQFDASLLILTIVYLAICIYALFIGFVVVMNLYDIRKIATDANKEKSNLEMHYPDLYTELKIDFAYMKNKRTRVRILAWAILLALLITLLSLTVFLLNHQQIKSDNFHFLTFIYN